MNRLTKIMVTSTSMLSASLLLLPCTQAAEPAAPRVWAKPRYILQSGRGWGVCEAYVKFLNAMPAGEDPPLCDKKVRHVPGTSEPAWEELDIETHLSVVHQIELLLGIGRIAPAPLQDFDLWKQQFRERIKAQSQAPRLRRVRLALVPDGPIETLLSYDQDVKLCKKEVNKMKDRELYRSSLGEPNFFVFDESQQRVMGSGYWVTGMAGTLTLYIGKPYYFDLYVEGGIGSEYINPGVLSGRLFVKRLEPAMPSESLKLNFPNDPLYSEHELCLIEFKYPIQRIRN